MTTEKSMAGWYFLVVALVVFVTAIAVRPDVLGPSLEFSLKIVINIIPVFILIFVLLVAFNMFINPKTLAEYLGKHSGVKGWLIAIVTGIISTGPIYMWYPLLNELQKAGARNGLLAAFLYNRAIKPALIPMIILYFGIKFTVILTFVMIFASIIQGMVVDRLVEVSK